MSDPRTRMEEDWLTMALEREFGGAPAPGMAARVIESPGRGPRPVDADPGAGRASRQSGWLAAAALTLGAAAVFGVLIPGADDEEEQAADRRSQTIMVETRREMVELLGRAQRVRLNLGKLYLRNGQDNGQDYFTEDLPDISVDIEIPDTLRAAVLQSEQSVGVFQPKDGMLIVTLNFVLDDGRLLWASTHGDNFRVGNVSLRKSVAITKALAPHVAKLTSKTAREFLHVDRGPLPSTFDAGVRHVLCTGRADRELEFLTGLGELTSITLDARSAQSGESAAITDAALRVLGRCQKLRTIRLVRCPLSDAGIAALAALPSLEGLEVKEIQGGGPTGAGFATMRGDSALRDMTIFGGGDGFSAVGLAALAALPNLYRVRLPVAAAVNPADLQPLFAHLSLRDLTLSGLQSFGPAALDRAAGGLRSLTLMSGSVDLGGLERMPMLQRLHLVGGRLTGKGLEPLGGLPLQSLNFFAVLNVRNADWDALAQLRGLRSLIVGGSSVAPRWKAMIAACAEMEGLRVLSLGGSALPAECGPALAKLRQLQVLELPREEVSAEVVKSIRKQLPEVDVRQR